MTVCVERMKVYRQPSSAFLNQLNCGKTLLKWLFYRWLIVRVLDALGEMPGEPVWPL
jgi:hypothetical protein